MIRTPKETVEAFWAAMQTNDFAYASTFLAKTYTLYYPQSKETFRGREDFVRLNSTYPANGFWRFTVHRIVAEGSQVVSDVSVTDGVVQARVIAFSRVEDGFIQEVLEFWPEPFDVPAWRLDWRKSE